MNFGEQGLQEKIKLVPIDLKNRPDWYKEKVYPANKVSLGNAIDLEAGFSVVTLKKQIVLFLVSCIGQWKIDLCYAKNIL